MENRSWSVGIFLYDDVEVLDFAGPYEVLSVAEVHRHTKKAYQPFNVRTVSENGELIHARNFLRIVPDFSIHNAPPFDVLIIPGGLGARRERLNQSVIQWIYEQSKSVQILSSVCTGAFLLAESGVLNGKKATTHWENLDSLATHYPQIQVLHNQRVVDEGKVMTSAGVSAGIEMALHIIERIMNQEIADDTARYMEYQRR